MVDGLHNGYNYNMAARVWFLNVFPCIVNTGFIVGRFLLIEELLTLLALILITIAYDYVIVMADGL